MISVPAFKSVSLICCGKHILNRSSYTQHLLSDWSFLNVYIQIRVLWLHHPNSVYWVEFKTLEPERLATLSLATASSWGKPTLRWSEKIWQVAIAETSFRSLPAWPATSRLYWTARMAAPWCNRQDMTILHPRNILKPNMDPWKRPVGKGKTFP